MSFANPTWLFLLLPIGLLILLLLTKRGMRGRWLRMLIATLLVLALADPVVIGQPTSRHLSLLIDRSLSTNGVALSKGRDIAEQIQYRYPDVKLQVLGAGKNASVLVSAGQSLEALSGIPLEDESDIGTGLRLVSGLTPDNAAHDVLLVSDGLHTGNDPLLEIPRLVNKHVRVFTLPTNADYSKDFAVVDVKAPSRVPLGQPYVISGEIYAPSAANAQLQLVGKNDEVLREFPVALNQGINRLSMAWIANSPGVQQHQLRVQLPEGISDRISQNNTARFAQDVMGPQQILVINTSGNSSNFSRALQSAGVGVRVQQGTKKMQLTSASLKHYVAVVLENMPLDKLPDSADRALRHYVTELGGGLLVTGGRTSYAMGGYYRSQLEDILPISLERKNDFKRPKVAVAVVMDRSGSMGAPAMGGATKMDLANRGTVEAMNLLNPQDEITVFAVDTQAHEIIPLQEVGSQNVRKSLQNKILSIESRGGGIYADVALARGIEELLKSKAKTRHLVLFSDAADTEQPGDYKNLIANWKAAGGSISVIGLGEKSDPHAPLLNDIASLGGGRLYFTRDALNLPRIFTQDVMQVARKTFLEQATATVPGRGLLALNFPEASVPGVNGYNLTFMRPKAELMLQTADKNKAPLMAAWQRGQGKVMAITFEADGPFTGPLAAWGRYPQFMHNAIEWLRGKEQLNAFVADMQLEGRRASIQLEVPEGTRFSENPTAVIIPPGETEPRRIPLRWLAPNLLGETIQLEQDGVYHGSVQIKGQAAMPVPARMLKYSPEYAPRQAGEGNELLQKLANGTQAALFTHIDDLMNTPPTVRTDSVSLIPWFLVAALLLILLEVAHRRALLDAPLRWIGGKVPRVKLPKRQPTSRTRSKRRKGATHSEPPADNDVPASTAETDKAPDSENVFVAAKRKANRD